MAVGIICEFNPFHNGHEYFIHEIKKRFDEEIILVLSGNFLERGDVSILSKWEKTKIALDYVDLVIELPFPFASQSADIFAHGAIQILNSLKVNKIIFGSETNQLEVLEAIARVQEQDTFQEQMKKYLDSGLNYPTALSNAIEQLTGYKIDSPNDLLAISYIKEIRKQKADIEPISIYRTNDYHSKELKNISSATSIRFALQKKIDVESSVPTAVYQILKTKDLKFLEDYFDFIRYTILTTKDLSIFQTVDEGIDYKMKKEIVHCDSLEEFILKIKSKRYTYNRIRRMLVHILCHFTKEEALRMKDVEYLRVLGFTNLGRNYLNRIKKDTFIPIITGYSNMKSDMLDLEYRVCSIYDMNHSMDELNSPIIK